MKTIRRKFISKKKSSAFLLFCEILLILVSAQAQTSVGTSNSEITFAAMPPGAERLLPDSVPAAFDRVFDELLKQGAGKIAGGKREILAWAGSYKSPAMAAKTVSQMQANFRTAGWQYEPQGKSGELDVFSLSKEGAPRRVVLGFFVPGDDVFVCALMEIHLPDAKSNAVRTDNTKSMLTDSSSINDSSAKILQVGKMDGYVNLMGSEMPEMPAFPALKAKPGFVRGYAKDWTGKPLAGAKIGVRSSYLAGMYSGSQGVTDVKGYYEFAVPRGSAHFYNAGYALRWGDGIAAVGLHPADGNLDGFVTTDGAVENFVLLPYGVTDRAKVQDNPGLPANYYGGSIWLYYGAYEASDNRPYEGYVPEDSIIEITLKSENGQTFVVKKVAGFQSYFRINNIPLDRYEISAKVNGKPLNMEFNKRDQTPFGMTPEKTSGAANVLLMPVTAKADMVAPQTGGWDAVTINLKAQ